MLHATYRRRTLTVLIALGVTTTGIVGCGTGETTPVKPAPASESVSAPAPTKKGTPGKPARQTPGAADYEDKGGGNAARGR